MKYEVLELYKVTLNRVLFFFLTVLCIIEGSSREEKDDFYNNKKPFGEEKVAGAIDVAQIMSQALQVHLPP